MKFEEYLSSPTVRGLVAGMNNHIKASLDIGYEKIKHKLSVSWYATSDQILIAHVKVPSNSLEKVFYDVILQFDLSSANGYLTLNHANTLFFSNCPSFVFTHAYSFHTKKLLCEWLTDKYDPKVLEIHPVEKNEYLLLTYEKSLYYACKFVAGRNNINQVKRFAVATSFQNIATRVLSSDAILALYNEEKKKKDNIKKKENTEKKIPTKKEPEKKKQSKSGISSVKSISSTKKNTSTKKTNKIKKI